MTARRTLRPSAYAPIRARDGQWMVGARAWCETCGWALEARNAQGVGAQHARRYGHNVRGEKGYGFTYSGEGR